MLVFKDRYALTADFLSQFAKGLARKDKIEMVIPKQIYSDLIEEVPAAWDLVFEPDLNKWLYHPTVWFRLNNARQVIEDYKKFRKCGLKHTEPAKGRDIPALQV